MRRTRGRIFMYLVLPFLAGLANLWVVIRYHDWYTITNGIIAIMLLYFVARDAVRMWAND